MIEFTCPRCGRPFRIEDAAAGKLGGCKMCGFPLVIPFQTLPATLSIAPPVVRPETPAVQLPPPIRVKALVQGFAVAMLTAMAIYISSKGWEHFLRLFSSAMESRLAAALSSLLWLATLLPALVGGYVAAAKARRNSVRHGLVMAIILMAFSCLFYLQPGAAANGRVAIRDLLLVFPVTVLGSLLFKMRVSL